MALRDRPLFGPYLKFKKKNQYETMEWYYTGRMNTLYNVFAYRI